MKLGTWVEGGRQARGFTAHRHSAFLLDDYALIHMRVDGGSARARRAMKSQLAASGHQGMITRILRNNIHLNRDNQHPYRIACIVLPSLLTFSQQLRGPLLCPPPPPPPSHTMSSWPQPTSKLEAEDKKRYQLYVAELKAADLENMTRDDFFRHMARIVSPPALPPYSFFCSSPMLVSDLAVVRLLQENNRSNWGSSRFMAKYRPLFEAAVPAWADKGDPHKRAAWIKRRRSEVEAKPESGCVLYLAWLGEFWLIAGTAATTMNRRRKRMTRTMSTFQAPRASSHRLHRRLGAGSGIAPTQTTRTNTRPRSLSALGMLSTKVASTACTRHVSDSAPPFPPTLLSVTTPRTTLWPAPPGARTGIKTRTPSTLRDCGKQRNIARSAPR